MHKRIETTVGIVSYILPTQLHNHWALSFTPTNHYYNTVPLTKSMQLCIDERAFLKLMGV